MGERDKSFRSWGRIGIDLSFHPERRTGFVATGMASVACGGRTQTFFVYTGQEDQTFTM